MNAPFRFPHPICKGRICARAMDVDQLIAMLEPFRGQNRRVLLNHNSAVTRVRLDGDGDVILKGH